MTAPKEATELAAAVAEQAHGGVEHGDNDRRATLDLELRFGIGGLVDQKVPRRDDTGDERPLCARWDDHRQGGETA